MFFACLQLSTNFRRPHKAVQLVLRARKKGKIKLLVRELRRLKVDCRLKEQSVIFAAVHHAKSGKHDVNRHR